MRTRQRYHSKQSKPAKPAIPPLYRRFRVFWAAVRIVYTVMAVALVLLPVGNSWTSLAALAPVPERPGVLAVGAAYESMSPFVWMADFIKSIGFRPSRLPWQPTGVDYGNTSVPRTMEGKPVYMAWQYRPTKLENIPFGVNVLAPTWFEVEDNEGVAEVNDLAHLLKGRIASWDPSQYVKTAHDGGVEVWATIQCMSKDELAKQIVTDEACRGRFISRITGWVQQFSLDGICFDFEFMDPADNEKYTALIAECKQALPPGIVVSVAVTVPVKNPKGNWWQCYDREGLGRVADYVAVMGYDNPDMEPVAAIDWLNGKIRDMLALVPAEKILLGVPFFGVDLLFDKPGEEVLAALPEFEKSKSRKTMTPSGVRSLVEKGFFSSSGKKIEIDYWIDKGTWIEEKAIAQYAFAGSDGLVHLVYCEDERSLEAKGRLLSYQRLGGAAVWKLEFGSPPMWEALFDGMAAVK